MITAALLLALTFSRHVRIVRELTPTGVCCDYATQVGVEVSGLTEAARAVQVECLPSPCPWGAGYALDVDNLNVLMDGPDAWFVGVTTWPPNLPLLRVRECPLGPFLCGPWTDENLCCTENCGLVIRPCGPGGP